MTKAIFKTLLVTALDLLNMSYKEAAKELKTAPGTISRWANGKSAPSEAARIAIVNHLYEILNERKEKEHG